VSVVPGHPRREPDVVRPYTSIATVVLDWGDTLMAVLDYDGAMADWPEVAAVPGAAEALAGLQQRARLVVVTSAELSDAPDVLRALARVGLAEYVADVITVRDIGVGKDEPGFWSGVLRVLHASAESVVVVGDDYVRDIASASLAGIRTVWLHDGSTGDAATLGIAAMTELPAALDRLDRLDA
jgi:HAD superfamily hydrolase (TIGR01509 family)